MSGEGVCRGLAAMVLCVGLAGCRHKPVARVLPIPAQAPVVLDKAPDSATAGLVQPVPLQPAPLPSVKVPAQRVKKPKRRVVAAPAAVQAPPAAVVPVQVATAGPVPEASVVGALTTGGEASPEEHRRVAELIAEIERRLKALPAAVVKKQREQIQRVRNFEAQAQKALNSGDEEGAMTLATKAKLMLDDLTK